MIITIPCIFLFSILQSCPWYIGLTKKFCLGFPVRSYGKTQTNFLANPTFFIGRTDAEAEAPVIWPPDVKSWFTGKDPDAGKDWGQEKGVTEDEMIGCHHQLNGHEFEQTPGDSEGQGSLTCCSSWSCKESDTIYQLNKNNETDSRASGDSRAPKEDIKPEEMYYLAPSGGTAWGEKGLSC